MSMTESEALDIARKAAVDSIEVLHNRIGGYDSNEKWTENATEECRRRIVELAKLLASPLDQR